MISIHAIPLLLSLLVGLVLGLIVWGLWQAGKYKSGSALMGTRDDLLPGLLLLAGFAMGAFMTYVLLSLRL